MEYLYHCAIADTADEGMDYFAMPIARVYGNRVYIFDCIFDAGKSDYTGIPGTK